MRMSDLKSLVRANAGKEQSKLPHSTMNSG
jgi:hypothetical protein